MRRNFVFSGIDRRIRGIFDILKDMRDSTADAAERCTYAAGGWKFLPRFQRAWLGAPRPQRRQLAATEFVEHSASDSARMETHLAGTIR